MGRPQVVDADGDAGKVKPLCLTKLHAMKTYGGMEVQLRSFLTSALAGGEWSAWRPGKESPVRIG
jgi:hypothetical protein